MFKQRRRSLLGIELVALDEIVQDKIISIKIIWERSRKVRAELCCNTEANTVTPASVKRLSLRLRGQRTGERKFVLLLQTGFRNILMISKQCHEQGGNTVGGGSILVGTSSQKNLHHLSVTSLRYENKGVEPSLEGASLLAPAGRSTSTTSRCPSCDATYKGFRPSLVGASLLAAARSNSTIFRVVMQHARE